jgi:hypothetical protein
MTWLVAVETVVLALLALLVVGLLRSHAEILRRLDELARGAGSPPRAAGPGARPDGSAISAPARAEQAIGADVAGTTLRGDALKVSVSVAETGTLLAFLSSGCSTCRTLWDGLRSADRPALPTGVRLVVVAKDASYESPTKLRELAPADVPVVLSSDAWDDYEVPGSPYFVFVDGGGRIAGEGMAQSWGQVVSLLTDALAEAAEAERFEPTAPAGVVELRPARRFGDRLDRVDAELARGGIQDGHPSLYGPGEGSTR